MDCLGEDATPLQTPKAKAGPSPDRRGPSERHFPAESKPPGSSGASASTALEPPLGCASGAGAAGGAEARGGGSSDGAVAQEADSRPVDADALSHALQVCCLLSKSHDADLAVNRSKRRGVCREMKIFLSRLALGSKNIMRLICLFSAMGCRGGGRPDGEHTDDAACQTFKLKGRGGEGGGPSSPTILPGSVDT